MFSKVIKYKDFNGEDQERTFWFHLSNAKLAVLASDKGLKIWAEEMAVLQDGRMILDKLRELIKMACGKRSDDGQRFIQTDEAQSELLDSPAFDELLFELFVGDNASKFFNALVPPEQQKQIEALAVKQGVSPESDLPAYKREGRRPTQVELRSMSKEEMQEAFAWAELQGK